MQASLSHPPRGFRSFLASRDELTLSWIVHHGRPPAMELASMGYRLCWLAGWLLTAVLTLALDDPDEASRPEETVGLVVGVVAWLTSGLMTIHSVVDDLQLWRAGLAGRGHARHLALADRGLELETGRHGGAARVRRRLPPAAHAVSSGRRRRSRIRREEERVELGRALREAARTWLVRLLGRWRREERRQ
jgi:hypothetical protein